MSTIDLTEAEDIKKRWQEYTKELYKKDLHDPDNHHGVITHLDREQGWVGGWFLKTWSLHVIFKNQFLGCEFFLRNRSFQHQH